MSEPPLGLRFRVECRDEAVVLGAGLHERAIIGTPKFLARAQAKAREPT